VVVLSALRHLIIGIRRNRSCFKCVQAVAIIVGSGGFRLLIWFPCTSAAAHEKENDPTQPAQQKIILSSGLPSQGWGSSSHVLRLSAISALCMTIWSGLWRFPGLSSTAPVSKNTFYTRVRILALWKSSSVLDSDCTTEISCCAAESFLAPRRSCSGPERHILHCGDHSL